MSEWENKYQEEQKAVSKVYETDSYSAPTWDYVRWLESKLSAVKGALMTEQQISDWLVCYPMEAEAYFRAQELLKEQRTRIEKVLNDK